MKPIVRRGLGFLLLAGCVTVWILSTGMASRQRRTRTCQGKGGLQVEITDSLERQFVGKEDVAQWLDREYRAYAGLPLDSVNLQQIERLVNAHSVVKESQAWLTDYGALHVRLSQREPIVRFGSGADGFYADETGFVFPLQARGSADVPVVDGAIPLSIPKGFKGTPLHADEQLWLSQMIGMVNTMRTTVWSKNIVRITVNERQDLLFTPRIGQERFLFGPPVKVKEKLRLMDAYYEAVVPLGKNYRDIDLRYGGQLICRQ